MEFSSAWAESGGYANIFEGDMPVWISHFPWEENLEHDRFEKHMYHPLLKLMQLFKHLCSKIRCIRYGD